MASRRPPPRVPLFEQRLALDLELDDAPLDLVDLLGQAVDLDPKPAGGFVHQVDRLVGQEPVADVAVREVAAATMALSVIRTPWWTSYFSLRPRRIAIVSATFGSPTITGWNRRSRAASFSMCLRYSSSVVAPIDVQLAPRERAA